MEMGHFRLNFEFEGTMKQLEEAMMRIVMAPVEKTVTERTERTQPAAEPVSAAVKAPAVKTAKKTKAPELAGKSKYNKTITIEQCLEAIDKHQPKDIAGAIQAILSECQCQQMTLGRLLDLNSYDMSCAVRGNTAPKIIKGFSKLNFPASAPVPVDGPLSIERIKAIIAAVKPSCLAALIAELKTRYSLVDVSKLMNCTTEALMQAMNGQATPLVLNIFRTRAGFPEKM